MPVTIPKKNETPVSTTFAWIDRKGQVAIKPSEKIYAAGRFSEGLARVTADDLHGYMDHRGHMVIRPMYSWAMGFREGLACVETPKPDDRWQFINKQNEVVIRLEKADVPTALFRYTVGYEEDAIVGFDHGLALIDGVGGLRYIDRTGRTVWPHREEHSKPD